MHMRETMRKTAYPGGTREHNCTEPQLVSSTKDHSQATGKKMSQFYTTVALEPLFPKLFPPPYLRIYALHFR